MEHDHAQSTPSCADCGATWQHKGGTNCWSSAPGALPRPNNCPSTHYGEVVENAIGEYLGDSEDARIALVAGQVEGLCYQPLPGTDAVNARWTRVEDTIAFAKLMNYKRIGIATCIGMLEESRRLTQILEAQGFQPMSVCCKAGSFDKLEAGLKESDKVRPGTFEPVCNPIAQAKICNAEKTDMNIIVGLCVGHDMLFSKHSEAPVTTLVVKDRVTGHNPIAVLYGQNFYYKRLQKFPLKVELPE